MVFEIISGNFKSLLTVKSISIDDKWDQCNRTYLVMFCIFSGTIMTLRQQLGSIIHCMGHVGNENAKEGDFVETNNVFVNDYCSAQGLYTYKEMYTLSWPDEVPYPGILPISSPICGYVYKNGTPVPCVDASQVRPFTPVYHVWYMFVPFYFCAVGIAFYFPYTVFRHLSGIYDMKPILNALVHSTEPNTPDYIQRNVDNISRWLYIKLDPYMNNELPYTQIIHKHSMFYTVMITKVMYLGTSILVFYGTNKVFQQGNFLTYGYDVFVSIPSGTDYKIMDTLFPKMVGCEIKIWGRVGLQKEALICVLPQNIGNQYFFLIFWVLLLLIVFSNAVSLFTSVFRFIYVAGGYKRFLAVSLLSDMERYRLVFTHVGSTGRYILHIIAEHSNPKVFEDLMEVICSLLISNYHKRRKKRERLQNFVGRSGRKSGFFFGDSSV